MPNNNNSHPRSKKRKQEQTNHSQQHPKHHHREKEDLTSKISRILGANNNTNNQEESSLVSSSSTSSSSRSSSSTNRRIVQPSSSSSSSLPATLPGFYFDSKANRYFPIPKNALERSLLVGNSEERSNELETHKMKQIVQHKKIHTLTTKQAPPPQSRGRNQIVGTPSTITLKPQKTTSTLLNSDRKNQFYSIIKSRIIHPSDRQLYNKHIVNRMENFKFLNSLSNIENWSNTGSEKDEILKFEGLYSNIHMLRCPAAAASNHNSSNNNETAAAAVIEKNLVFSSRDYRVEVGELHFRNNENNFQHLRTFLFDEKPIYSILEMKNMLNSNSNNNNNRQTQLNSCHHHTVNLIVTPKQTSELCIFQINLMEDGMITPQFFNLSKNKTVFSHALNSNNGWCAIGLNKGGLVIDLKLLITKKCNTAKAATIAFISNQFSDILLTYWNPFISLSDSHHHGELFYARRDGGLYISQLGQSVTSSKAITYSQQEIACLQYGPESFIGQILSLDEDRFLVKSVCRNGAASFGTFIHMFDKRKLAAAQQQQNGGGNNQSRRSGTTTINHCSPFHCYEVLFELNDDHDNVNEQQSSIRPPTTNNLSTIMDEVNNMKMFIHDSRFLICGGAADGLLRVWDVFSGGKPITTKKLPCYSVTTMKVNGNNSNSNYCSSSSTSTMSDEHEYLIMSLASGNVALGVPLH